MNCIKQKPGATNTGNQNNFYNMGLIECKSTPLDGICQEKKSAAYIFNEFINCYGQHKVEVVCPHCHYRSTHGKVSLDMARGCNNCSGSYYITEAPTGWTPPPEPFRISDIGERPARYGLKGTFDDVEETAPEFTEAFYKQQRYRLMFRRWPQQEIDALEKRQRAEFKKLEEMEQREKRRKIITHRTKDDFTALKKLLPEYLRLKGVHYDPRRKTWRCPNPSHQDTNPSAVLYDRQEKPVLYCPVCNKCYDLFNIESMLTGETHFPEVIKSVKRCLGVI